jgi:hypothetical protein
MKHLLAIDVAPFAVHKDGKYNMYTHVVTYFTLQINGNINGFFVIHSK